ncbi:MAG TPA: Nramp family divalent metal transporter [Bryobacterales bacterium]|nr:Nramp family divalent metal transporter [Bryobacterales bacterium]
MPSRPTLFAIIAPGILLAATGVGAGDLLTATLAGNEVGLPVLWAAVAGAILKWTLNEGLARWQLGTNSTLLEGWVWKLGGWIQWFFLTYLVLFTLAVGGALASACGVAASAFLPLSQDPDTSKILWGVLHSFAGYLLVRYGSFRLFEVLMSVFIALMFGTVVLTAVLIGPDWAGVARGFVPSVPRGGSAWLLAVMGGVGGTVTLMSYGYWIREQGRESREDIRICRIDLAVGYMMTALFGIAVIIIGSHITVSNQGATLAVEMADELARVVGPWGRYAFLAGFWGAVFSSLLGVWQSIPYLFADIMDLRGGMKPGIRRSHDLRAGKPYRMYLAFIATVPLIFLWTPVRSIQLSFGVLAAFFLPLMALTLLIMNNRRQWVGADFVSHWGHNVILGLGFVFFAYVGVTGLIEQFAP